jgi:hypothetical protein
LNPFRRSFLNRGSDTDRQNLAGTTFDLSKIPLPFTFPASFSGVASPYISNMPSRTGTPHIGSLVRPELD